MHYRGTDEGQIVCLFLAYLINTCPPTCLAYPAVFTPASDVCRRRRKLSAKEDHFPDHAFIICFKLIEIDPAGNCVVVIIFSIPDYFVTVCGLVS